MLVEENDGKMWYKYYDENLELIAAEDGIEEQIAFAEKFNEKESLKAQLTDIQKVNEQLEVSVENELNLTSIEKLAKERLGMSKLNNEQKIYINLPKKEYVEVNTNDNKQTNSTNIIQKACESVKEFFK